jgi:hypothetical protein
VASGQWPLGDFAPTVPSATHIAFAAVRTAPTSARRWDIVSSNAERPPCSGRAFPAGRNGCRKRIPSSMLPSIRSSGWGTRSCMRGACRHPRRSEPPRRLRREPVQRRGQPRCTEHRHWFRLRSSWQPHPVTHRTGSHRPGRKPCSRPAVSGRLRSSRGEARSGEPDSTAPPLIASGDNPERLAMTSRSCGWHVGVPAPVRVGGPVLTPRGPTPGSCRTSRIASSGKAPSPPPVGGAYAGPALDDHGPGRSCRPTTESAVAQVRR